ncbi:hypothetical protein M422DRAFT_265258 [Sphaerobolus stellatus SS14]|uniref:Uncharacterized protein n=1 Tax=Sphaerobolus stellatus (strain SS14) TaxID=990650 RepID=A0A0C9TRY0_SPHS4|nr:hypothetical protein M422DRAFT_265258 [Sphaerobolus stellatus SS14]
MATIWMFVIFFAVIGSQTLADGDDRYITPSPVLGQSQTQDPSAHWGIPMAVACDPGINITIRSIDVAIGGLCSTNRTHVVGIPCNEKPQTV